MIAARILPLLLLGVLGAIGARLADPASQDMAAAARRYLDSLSPELRARANPKFEDPAQSTWNFLPGKRPGVTFGEMSDEQRGAARALMRASLSTQGVLKAEAVMALDGVLRELEKGQPSASTRDPMAYVVTVYGEPRSGSRWGWKLEGHHLSLNFTPVEDGAAVTPSFMGANPAELRAGPRAGLRVLALEEDLARDLMKSLDEAERKEAVLAASVPGDILTSPGRSLDAASSVGLAYSSMSAPQRALLDQLLAEFAGNLRQELAAAELSRIRRAGVDSIRFAWLGSAEPGKPHYYRISGPTFVIEFDNTQDQANHVHTVWHDRERDFGRDALKEHLQSK